MDINIDFAFLLMNNFFTLSKKQQKCNISEVNKDFSVDGNEYNVLNYFLLFSQRYKLKYKLYQLKDNLFLWFFFINNKKMRIVRENTKS